MKKLNAYWLLPALVLASGCGHNDKPAPAGEGEFTLRLEMVKDRMTGDRYKPEFTPEFVLGDVNLDPANPRRFYNYSGDLSGRYIDALSLYYGKQKNAALDSIVQSILSYQQPDGRFGDPALVFTKETIDHNHMPLFWGNGRMLVGLLQYYKNTQNPAVLEAARKTGDFFLSSYKEVTPEVAARLKGYGADGIICFTQYTEGLVMLSEATDDPKYAATAAAIYPTLPGRTTLHTHGYLSTLKGVLDLYRYTGDTTHFNYVRERYDDLVNSDDYTIYGSVMEFFGGQGRSHDEGCSTVDFVTLSLHLYEVTGDPQYLERAEFALYNELYFNQYFTGDFGHHRIDYRTSSTDGGVKGAWWCCTMAGLKALVLVRDHYFVKNEDGKLSIDLYLDTDYTDENAALRIRRGEREGDYHLTDIRFDKADMPLPLRLRNPSWAETTEIFLNGKKIDAPLADNYFTVNEKLKKGDELRLKMKYKLRLIRPDKTQIAVTEVKDTVQGALCYGPYLLAVDDQADYTFLSEPNNNLVYVNTLANATDGKALSRIAEGSYVKDAYLTANYRHDGFPSYYQTVFRPVSEMTFHRHPFMMVTMNFVPESAVNPKLIDKTKMEVSWGE